MKKRLIGKKVLSMVLGATLVVGLFTACGGSGSQQASNNSASTASTSNADANAGGQDTGDAEVVISVSLTTADESACNKIIYYLGDQIKEKSGGRMVLDVYPNGTLANDTGSVEGVQLGNIGMTLVSSANYSAFDANQAVFDLPFLFASKEDAYKFFDSDVAKELAASLDNYGFHCFGYMDYGYRLLTNNVKPVTSFDDLSGMKVRTMSSEYQVLTWECLKTVPTPISFSELFTALQQGTVDGQENPWGNIISQKFYEVQKYATDTHHILTVCPMVISKDVYDSLPDDLRGILDECAQDALVKARDMVNEEEANGAKTATDGGMEVSEMPAEEIAKMREACQPVYDKMRDQVGDMVDKVQDFLK